MPGAEPTGPLPARPDGGPDGRRGRRSQPAGQRSRPRFLLADVRRGDRACDVSTRPNGRSASTEGDQLGSTGQVRRREVDQASPPATTDTTKELGRQGHTRREADATEWALRIEEEGPVPWVLGEGIKTGPPGRPGRHIGTDSQRVSRYENGRITPSVAALVRIAEVLDVSIDYLLVEDAPAGPSTSPTPTWPPAWPSWRRTTAPRCYTCSTPSSPRAPSRPRRRARLIRCRAPSPGRCASSSPPPVPSSASSSVRACDAGPGSRRNRAARLHPVRVLASSFGSPILHSRLVRSIRCVYRKDPTSEGPTKGSRDHEHEQYEQKEGKPQKL